MKGRKKVTSDGKTQGSKQLVDNTKEMRRDWKLKNKKH
jgi:hypothetical protein